MSSNPIRSSALLAALVVGVAVLSSSLQAQTVAPTDPVSIVTQVAVVATPAPVATAEPGPLTGPRVAPAGIARPSEAGPLVAQNGAHLGAGSNLALMGVGAAGVVIGLLVGGNAGTAIAIGSGVVGLVGLYRYLR